LKKISNDNSAVHELIHFVYVRTPYFALEHYISLLMHMIGDWRLICKGG